MWLTESAGGTGGSGAVGNSAAKTRRYEAVKRNKIKTIMTDKCRHGGSLDIGSATLLVERSINQRWTETRTSCSNSHD